MNGAPPSAQRPQLIAHAKAYPYARPAMPALLTGEHIRALRRFDPVSGEYLLATAADESPTDTVAGHLPPRAVENPLLAVGANGSPAVLGRKLSALGHRPQVVMLQATVLDHAVVYSAHLSAYGSVPATIQHSPGSYARVAVLFMPPEQLEALHASESLGVNYAFGRLDTAPVALESGETLEAPSAYLSLHGALMRNGEPLALDAISQSCPYPALTQESALNYVCELVSPGVALDDFIVKNVLDGAWRSENIRSLSRMARRGPWAGFRPLRPETLEQTVVGD